MRKPILIEYEIDIDSLAEIYGLTEEQMDNIADCAEEIKEELEGSITDQIYDTIEFWKEGRT